VYALCAFKDNYIWLFTDKAKKAAWIVDPGDAQPVINYLTQNNLQLAGILITHHHWDHSDGIKELIERWKNIPVIGFEKSAISSITKRVKEGDEILCGSLKLRVLHIPGHTLDHIAFYNDEVLFCGDTLFSAGCGRVFEGTYEEMYRSLMKLARLPHSIKIYCGHEYTLQNLYFAAQVEPENEFIRAQIEKVKIVLKNGQPTLPSTLTDEKNMNPFLRCEVSEVRQAAEKHVGHVLSSEEEVFRALREWKNNFN